MDNANNSGPRKPWVAFVLSLLAPGLGHVYNGDFRSGVVRFVMLLAGGAAVFFAWAYLVPSVSLLPVVLLCGPAAGVVIAITAYRRSRQLRANMSRSWYSRWYGLIGVYLFVVIVAMPAYLSAVRYVVQAYKLPSASMLPTLVVGDHVVVTKLCYSAKLPFTDRVLVTFHTPERGDIVVLKYPEDERKDFIQRVVGLPGDVVEVRNQDLYVNGEPADTSHIQHIDPTIRPGSRDNFGPVTVPDHSYFMMGDNRDRSLDSRFWGFLQENKIRGKAILIYWSWNREEGGIRWDRIGQRL